MFIFQWIRYSSVLICFWLRNRPSIKYVRNWKNGGSHPKCVNMCTGGEGLKNLSSDMYVLSKWAEANVVESFLYIGLPKYIRVLLPARKMSLFSSIIITIFFIVYDDWNLVSLFYIRISTKKQAAHFLKKNF